VADANEWTKGKWREGGERSERGMWGCVSRFYRVQFSLFVALSSSFVNARKKEVTLLREINIIFGGNESFVAEPQAPASSPSLEISRPLWEIWFSPRFWAPSALSLSWDWAASFPVRLTQRFNPFGWYYIADKRICKITIFAMINSIKFLRNILQWNVKSSVKKKLTRLIKN